MSLQQFRRLELLAADAAGAVAGRLATVILLVLLQGFGVLEERVADVAVEFQVTGQVEGVGLAERALKVFGLVIGEDRLAVDRLPSRRRRRREFPLHDPSLFRKLGSDLSRQRARRFGG